MNGNLSCLSFEYRTSDSHYITDIHLFEFFIGFLTDTVSGNIRLDIAL